MQQLAFGACPEEQTPLHLSDVLAVYLFVGREKRCRSSTLATRLKHGPSEKTTDLRAGVTGVEAG